MSARKSILYFPIYRLNRIYIVEMNQRASFLELEQNESIQLNYSIWQYSHSTHVWSPHFLKGIRAKTYFFVLSNRFRRTYSFVHLNDTHISIIIQTLIRKPYEIIISQSPTMNQRNRKKRYSQGHWTFTLFQFYDLFLCVCMCLYMLNEYKCLCVCTFFASSRANT